MSAIKLQSSKGRRWPLAVALVLGVLAGAAADAVVTLRGANAIATGELHRSDKPVQAETVATLTAADMSQPESAACSCVGAQGGETERSLLVLHRKHARAARHAAPAPTGLCATSLVAQ